VTDVSEELTALIIRVERMNELGTTIALFLVNANVVSSLLILLTLMMEAIKSSETSFFQELHGVTSQKTAVILLVCWICIVFLT
jgi:hypothetical protein